jgi:hypothetical protein
MSFTLRGHGGNHVAYVALGMARGHLMMAAVVRSFLLSQGFTMSVYTTSLDGKIFFEAVTSSTCHLLSDAYRFVFDDAHNMYMRKSVGKVARYALSGQILHDIAQVRGAFARAGVIVNDIHPTPIIMQRSSRRSRQAALVNVLSEHSLGAVEHIFAGWLPGIAGRLGKAAIRSIFSNCAHLIINTLEPTSFFYTRDNITFLPPIVQPVNRSTIQVREDLCIPTDRPLFVAYLNPLFRRRELLTQLVNLANHHNAFLYVVSESLVNFWQPMASDHVRVVPYDFEFGEKIHAADLLISGAGLAAPIQAYAYGVPLVVLVSAHPEHERNAATIANYDMGVPVKDLASLLPAAARAFEHKPQAHMDIIELTRLAWLTIIDQAERQR